jgi:hypothetical protein
MNDNEADGSDTDDEKITAVRSYGMYRSEGRGPLT